MHPTRAPESSTDPAAWPRRALLASGLASAAAITVGRTAGASTAPVGPDGSAPRGGGGAGFATPEAAVAAYLDALAAGDFDGALAAFAMEDYVEHYDLAASLRWLRFYMPLNAPQALPNSDPFNVAVNLAHRRATVAGQVTNQYFALVNPGFDLSPTGMALDDDAAVAELVGGLEAAMTADPLADVADYEFTPIELLDEQAAEVLSGDRGTELNERLLTITGADEAVELAVRTAIGGRAAALLFRTVRYGDAWWLETLQGQMATLMGLEPLAPGVLWLEARADGTASSDPAG